MFFVFFRRNSYFYVRFYVIFMSNSGWIFCYFGVWVRGEVIDGFFLFFFELYLFLEVVNIEWFNCLMG